MFVQVLPGLYLGDRYAAREAEFDIVINCTTNIPFPADTDADLVRVEVDDVGEMEDVLKLKLRMPSLIALIRNELATNKLILVHCNMGRQRSCAVVASYLMYHDRITREQAIDKVKAIKPDAFFPDVNFREAIHCDAFS